MVGLIETVRVRGGEAPLWPLHAARVAAAAEALCLVLPPLSAPAAGADRIVRFEIGPAGAAVSERPLPPPVPLRLIVSAERHVPYPFKTTERAPFDRAHSAARAAGADDAVLLTRAGLVAEASRWGLYWWDQGRLCVPAFRLGVLASVARARIEQLAGPLDQREVLPRDIAGRALFAANAARGIVEVASWDGHAVPRTAETAVLAERFWP